MLTCILIAGVALVVSLVMLGHVESLRKLLKWTGTEITATRKPQQALHAFTNTTTLTLLLHIIES